MNKRYDRPFINGNHCSGHCARCPESDDCPARRAAEGSTVALSSKRVVKSTREDKGTGFVIDVGSTTLAVELYDLGTGVLLAARGCMNPQSAIAADVIGRISAASTAAGLSRLRNLVMDALDNLLDGAAKSAGITRADLADGVVTGNTVMLHLLFGRDPSSLGVAPFRAEWLGGSEETLLGKRVFVAPAIGAFTGADLVTALVAAGMDGPGETALLCDMGTNAEAAVRVNGRLYVTSTAAGPAFEGTGVRGSELLDAIAAFRASGAIGKTGESEPGSLILADGRTLREADVRAVQMAKAAIAAGVSLLLEEAGVSESDLAVVYLAGGFGCGLDPESAVAIGMLPRTPGAKMIPLANAALAGAAILLLDPGRRESAARVAREAVAVELGGNASFSGRFIASLSF